MESETNSMPPVIGVKWWPRLSALFSMITLIIQILNWQFFTMATWIPAFLIGEPGNYISLIFSILAFGCLILDVDVPGKFGKQLEKISELREIGIEKLRKCRGWVLACYTSANIMGGMLIDQITVGFDLLKFGFLVLAFSIMVATLNKFKALIRGTENIELVSQVDASYMMGFIFSLVLGLGGEFYLSTWIFIVNLIRVLQKKEKRSEKINDIEYWDKVISIEIGRAHV